jgi:hypothetical protein
VIQHPDHRVSDGSRLTTRSWRTPQPSHTSRFPAPPSNGLAWCSAILLQCLRSCARFPHSLAANLFWDLIPAPGRSLTSSRSLRSSFHRPSSEEGFRSGGVRHPVILVLSPSGSIPSGGPFYELLTQSGEVKFGVQRVGERHPVEYHPHIEILAQDHAHLPEATAQISKRRSRRACASLHSAVPRAPRDR